MVLAEAKLPRILENEGNLNLSPEHDEIGRRPDLPVREPNRHEAFSQVPSRLLGHAPQTATFEHRGVAHEGRDRERRVDHLVHRALFEDGLDVRPVADK